MSKSSGYEVMMSLPPDADPNLMFLVFPWLEIYRFQTGHFPDFQHLKIDSYFLTLGKSKWTLLVHFSLLWLGQLFFWLWASCYAAKKQPKFSLTKNSRARHRIWHEPFSMFQSVAIKINRLQRFNLFFL